MSEIVITKENFESEVLKSDVPVLLDFRADWCGPCKMLSPIITDIAKKYEGKVKVGTVDVDEQPELASAFRVSAIPLLAVIKDGRVTNTAAGYMPAGQVEALLR